MNVSLTPKLEELVQAKLATGMYNSASEVIREALRLLEERDRLHEIRFAELRREVSKGLDQLAIDDATEYDEKSLRTLAKNVKANGRKRLAAKNKRRA